MPTPDFSKVWASNSPLPAYTFSDSDYLTGWDFVGSAPPTKNEFDAWFKMVDEKLNYLYSQLQDTASKLYPVGSVYISFSATDPSTLFGGTWTRLKDRMLMASGDSYAPNTTGGSATKTIGVTNLPAHNHTVNSAGTHNHTASTGASGIHSHSASTGASGVHNHSASTSIAGSHTHTASSVSAGSHNHWTMDSIHTASFDRQTAGANLDYIDIYYGDDGRYNGDYRDAKTSSNGSHTHTINVNSNGTHTHTVTVDNSTSHTHTVTVANSTSHTHTVTVNNGGSHTHTTNNTGGGTPLNILPPYQTVYMWRRTA